MRVLLTVPISLERVDIGPDLGLAYLAAHVRKAGHEVRVLDCLLEKYGDEDFVGYLQEFQPDVVGFKTFSCDIDAVRKMITLVRTTLPEAIVVIGGPHPSVDIPTQIFHRFPGITAAFAGEAEVSFVSFLERYREPDADFSDISGLIWMDSEGQVRANSKVFSDELDALEFPAWDLIDPSRYNFGFTFMSSKLPAVPIMITRGCPYLCTFCSCHHLSGRKVRRRSIDNVIEEIKLLIQKYGVRTIDIVDENFAFQKKYILEFCDRLIRENIKIAWNCPDGVRLNDLDEDVVKQMERSGCFGMSVGIESGSQRVLDLIKKKLTVAEVIEKVTMVKRVSNMYVQGYFMMGFPSETSDEIKQTIRLACSLPLDLAGFYPLQVSPGTAIFEELLAAGKVDTNLNFEGMGRYFFERSYSDVSDKEMLQLHRQAYISFYFRPKVILNLLRKVRTLTQVHYIVHGLLRLVHNPLRSQT